jgi:hypothetical protein
VRELNGRRGNHVIAFHILGVIDWAGRYRIGREIGRDCFQKLCVIVFLIAGHICFLLDIFVSLN